MPLDMAIFSVSFKYVMLNEDSTLSGNVVPEPHGGKARFGVNSIAHPEAVEAGFYEMHYGEAWVYAQTIFKNGYWAKVRGQDILDQCIANKFVDLSFDLGPHPATKIVQRAINKLHDGMVLMVDGVAGHKTLSMLNVADPLKLMVSIKDYGTQYYKDIVSSHPELKKYYDGWIKRLNR